MHVHRGRSMSTTSGLKSPLGEVQHREVVRTSSDGRSVADSGPLSGGNSASKSVARKKSAPLLTTPTTPVPEETSQSVEELFLDVILQRHARRLLSSGRLRDLGFLTAHFDCPLVAWLSRERSRAARIDDFVSALRRSHADFHWPFPSLPDGYRRHSNQSGRSNGFDVLEVDVTSHVTPLPAVSRRLSSAYSQAHYGDSGYLSNGFNEAAESAYPWSSNGSKGVTGGLLLQTVEAHLKPLAKRKICSTLLNLRFLSVLF